MITKKRKNIVGAVNDIASITAITTSALISTQTLSSASLATTIATTNHNRLKKINMVSIKLVNRLAVPLYIFSSVSDSIDLYKDGNYLASGANFVKMGIVLVGLFNIKFLLASIAIEILWYQYSHIIIKTQLERYIESSLLYKSFGFFFAKKYNAIILNKTVEEGNSELEAQSFRAFKDIRDFIGSNYDSNKGLFDTALANELSFFRTALNGAVLDIENIVEKIELKDETNRVIYLLSNNMIKIPKYIADDKEFRILYRDNNNKYLEFRENDLIKKDNFYVFSCFSDEFMRAFPVTLYFNNKNKTINTNIILLSSQINSKYKITIQKGEDKVYDPFSIGGIPLKNRYFYPTKFVYAHNNGFNNAGNAIYFNISELEQVNFTEEETIMFSNQV